MRRPLACLCLLFASACVTDTELLPAAAEQRVEGSRNRAVERVAGVEIEVEGAPTVGLPAGTEDLVSIVGLRVHNRSGVPLRLRYAEIRLREADGSERRALPPFALDSRAYDELDPAFVWDRFFVAAPYAPFMRGMPTWDGPFEADPFYYSSYFSRWGAPALPTPEMLAYALPEGVLVSGGTISGLVYFEGTPDADQLVTFVFELLDADTGARLGRVEVPFYVVPVRATGRPVARR